VVIYRFRPAHAGAAAGPGAASGDTP